MFSAENRNCEFQKYGEMLNDFEQKLVYHDRFVHEHELLTSIRAMAGQCETTLRKGAILYRARLFGDGFISQFDKEHGFCLMSCAFCYRPNDKQTDLPGPFYGYDEKNSYVISDPDQVKAGRCNPDFIPYLYAAESKHTAIIEVRPNYESCISVAEIEVLEDLRVFNLSNKGRVDGGTSQLRSVLSFCFSKIINDVPKQRYLITQFISEYIKKLGFTALKFDSSLDRRGCNVVVFDIAKCKATSSKVHMIHDIVYTEKQIFPKE